jgi:hypothetical protein
METVWWMVGGIAEERTIHVRAVGFLYALSLLCVAGMLRAEREGIPSMFRQTGGESVGLLPRRLSFFDFRPGIFE